MGTDPTPLTKTSLETCGLKIKYFDILDYVPVWQAMKEHALLQEDRQDELWVLQHQPVYTRGLRCRENPSAPGRHIPVVDVDRGGLMTYHGPGQLVLYCLIDLRYKNLNIRQIVNLLEQSVINLLNEHGIASNRIEGAPGVYIGQKKIAAIGLRVKNKRTYHGISVNFDMDLTPFEWINPCGFKSLEVIQLKELVDGFDWQTSQSILIREFAELFDFDEISFSRERNDSNRSIVPISIQSSS